MKISEFPESLRPILEEIDNEGDGMLEIDEITEIFQMFAAQKKAAKHESNHELFKRHNN